MVFEILYFLIVASSILLVLLENRRPYVSIFWILLLTIFPVVGLLIFFLIGRDHRFARVIKPEEMQRLAARRDEAHAAVQTNLEPESKYSKLVNMMHRANDAPLFEGNDVQIFTEFGPMFDAMLADIEQATDYVHIQFYKIEDDEVGRQLSQLMVRKAQEGVDVRLIFDSFANLFVRNRYYDDMRRGGVKVQSFLKLVPSMLQRDVNCRTHRKIVVIDGRVGYTGGMNIAKRYRDGIKSGIWRDTHVRICGPVVSQLEMSLLADWRFGTKELLDDGRYFPAIPEQVGHSKVQIITSGPMDDWNTVMQGMVQVIAQSRRYLYVQSPYFIPTEPILLALRNAALAGVDVRLMLPDNADRGAVMLYASESYFNDVMRAGVKVYSYHKGYLHAKTMVCDDDFVTIGSTNIDSRSMEQNFEANAFIYDPEVAMRQRDIFLADMEDCTLVDPEQWEKRKLGRRLLQSFSRLLTPLL